MRLSQFFIMISFILFQSLSFQCAPEEIDQNLVARYKTGDLKQERENHASWWKKQISRLPKIKTITDEEYKAANEAQRQIDNAEVERLKSKHEETANTLKNKKWYHIGIFKPKEIALAEQAQRKIDATTKETMRKKNQDELFQKLKESNDQGLLMYAASLFKNETLPKGLQRAINQKFMDNPKKFPDEGIQYLQLNNEIIEELSELKKLDEISDLKIEEYLNSVNIFLNSISKKPELPNNNESEEITKYIKSLEKLKNIIDPFYNYFFLNGNIRHYIALLEIYKKK